ncbi:protein MpNPF13 [Marchantia polymorpha subsp. ruderalis]
MGREISEKSAHLQGGEGAKRDQILEESKLSQISETTKHGEGALESRGAANGSWNAETRDESSPPDTLQRYEHALDGSTDWYGRPARRATTGGWKAAKYITVEQVLVNWSYFGIGKNLVLYMTAVMHQGNADGSNYVTNWMGAVFVAPLIGAFMADSNRGRYFTTFVFSALFGIGLLILTISTNIHSLRPPQCPSRDLNCKSATAVQSTVLTIGLYMAGIAFGALTPPVTVFGADQFDENDAVERKQRSSYWNWNYQAITLGAMGAAIAIVTIQENVSWGLGYGICAGLGFVGMSFFVGASKLYRFQKLQGNAAMRIAQVLVAASRKLTLRVKDVDKLYEEIDPESEQKKKINHTNGFKILDKAALWTPKDQKAVQVTGKVNQWYLCPVTQVEEVKSVLRLLPIFATTIIYSTVYMQMTTLFVVQGDSMDTRVGTIKIPSATLSVVEQITIVPGVILYDRLLVPALRRYTGHPKGFSDLKRMGVGLVLSIIAMGVSALVEAKRLQVARRYGLLEAQDEETAPVPLSIMWLIPQYFLVGISEVFTYIGLMEMFYDECPESLRSVSNAIQLLTNSLGSYFSTILITVVNKVTRKDGGWISNDNLNTGHLDRFYWLMVVLSLINFLLYVFFAIRYKPLQMVHPVGRPPVELVPFDDGSKGGVNGQDPSSLLTPQKEKEKESFRAPTGKQKPSLSSET